MLSGSLMLSLSGSLVLANQSDLQLAEKARIDVAKVGIGREARVEVSLKDRTKIKGYVSQVEADSFVVTDAGGATRSVAYADVAKVSKKSNGFWTRTKVITAVAVGVGLIVTWSIVKGAFCDGGAGDRGPC